MIWEKKKKEYKPTKHYEKFDRMFCWWPTDIGEHKVVWLEYVDMKYEIHSYDGTNFFGVPEKRYRRYYSYKYPSMHNKHHS